MEGDSLFEHPSNLYTITFLFVPDYNTHANHLPDFNTSYHNIYEAAIFLSRFSSSFYPSLRVHAVLQLLEYFSQNNIWHF